MGPGIGRILRPEPGEEALRDVDKHFRDRRRRDNAFAGHLDLSKPAAEAGSSLRPIRESSAAWSAGLQVRLTRDRLEMGRGSPRVRCRPRAQGQADDHLFAGGDVFINPTGNPALSKGGAGDVLTGFTGGLAGQGYSSTEAAVFGAYTARVNCRHVCGGGRPTWICLLAISSAGLGEALRDIRNGTDRVYIGKSL